MEEVILKLENENIGLGTVEFSSNSFNLVLNSEYPVSHLRRKIFAVLENIDMIFEKYEDRNGWGRIIIGDLHNQRELFFCEFKEILNIRHNFFKNLNVIFKNNSEELTVYYPGTLDWTGNFHKAIKYFENEKFSQALSALEKVSEADKILNCNNLRGFLFKKTRKFRNAQQFYRRELENFRWNSVCWSNLGILYRQIAELEVAIDCFKKSLLLDPLDIEPLFSAVSTFSLILEKHRNDFWIYFSLLHLFYKNNPLYPELLSIIKDRLGSDEEELSKEAENLYTKDKEMLQNFSRVRKLYVLGLVERAKKEKEIFLQDWQENMNRNPVWNKLITKFFQYRERFLNE
jgi:tetratricopeptide (TPR) repeat protein